MKYCIKAFNRKTGQTYAYVSVKDKSEWSTLATATKHAREFNQRFPEYLTQVECSLTGRILTRIKSVSTPGNGSMVSVQTNCCKLFIPTHKLNKLYGMIGKPSFDNCSMQEIAIKLSQIK